MNRWQGNMDDIRLKSNVDMYVLLDKDIQSGQFFCFKRNTREGRLRRNNGPQLLQCNYSQSIGESSGRIVTLAIHFEILYFHGMGLLWQDDCFDEPYTIIWI